MYTVLGPDLYMGDKTKLYVKFSDIIFNNNMIKITDIFVGMTESILQQINIHWYKKNNQHYMLAHPDFNNISIKIIIG